jgi:hypothetical protein
MHNFGIAGLRFCVLLVLLSFSSHDLPLLSPCALHPKVLCEYAYVTCIRNPLGKIPLLPPSLNCCHGRACEDSLHVLRDWSFSRDPVGGVGDQLKSFIVGTIKDI